MRSALLSAGGYGVLASGHQPARADIEILGEEVGGSVIFTISGSLTATPTAVGELFSARSGINPSYGGMSTWPTKSYGDVYEIDSELSFGTGAYLRGDISTGDNFRLTTAFLESGPHTGIWLDESYSPGDPIDATLTFQNTNFDVMGIDAKGGPYVWTITQSRETITLELQRSAEYLANIERLERRLFRLERRLRSAKFRRKSGKARKFRKKIRRVKRILATL